MIKVIEPTRAVNLMRAMNDFVVKDSILKELVPYTADIFVFSYPVYLVALYMYGINKKSDYYKEAALMVFFSSMWAAVVNIIIQALTDKSRPEEYILNKENLILSHLPTDPFPSDHAAVSAAIAMATYTWGKKNNDPFFIKVSFFFWFASLTMWLSRVSVAIHWPTDVLMGWLVWIWITALLFQSTVWKRLKQKVFAPLIALEKRIFKTCFKIEQW